MKNFNEKKAKALIKEVLELRVWKSEATNTIIDLRNSIQALKWSTLKPRQVERATRNYMHKDAINLTNAAKHFGVPVIPFCKVLRDDVGMIRKPGYTNLAVKSWRVAGLVTCDGSQPFITPAGIKYLENMRKRGELPLWKYVKR